MRTILFSFSRRENKEGNFPNLSILHNKFGHLKKTMISSETFSMKITRRESQPEIWLKWNWAWARACTPKYFLQLKVFDDIMFFLNDRIYYLISVKWVVRFIRRHFSYVESVFPKISHSESFHNLSRSSRHSVISDFQTILPLLPHVTLVTHDICARNLV